MEIRSARAMGWCFGVRDAFHAASSVPNPDETTIYGELVHNEQVLHQLHNLGLRQVAEAARGRVPDTATVLITAHGVSNQTRESLLAAGRTLIDTTCPLVRRVHAAASRLAAEDRHLIVIGQPGHVEVLGIVEDHPGSSVWPDEDSVQPTGYRRLGIVAQSTTRPDVGAAVVDRIRELHPDADVRWVDTICEPTRERQSAVDELLDQVTVLVVVGGQRSNNSRALAERASVRGIRAHLVQTEDQLDSAWFTPDDIVGLTAGTSTPDDAIAAVHARLKRIHEQQALCTATLPS